MPVIFRGAPFAAHRGYLEIIAVMLIAFVATLAEYLFRLHP